MWGGKESSKKKNSSSFKLVALRRPAHDRRGMRCEGISLHELLLEF